MLTPSDLLPDLRPGRLVRARGGALTALLVAVAMLGGACGSGRRAAGVGSSPAPSGAPDGSAPAGAHARRGSPSPAEQRAIRRVLGYTSYISVGSRRRKDIALTFDDGPSPFTPRVLAILRREHVPATFFEIGRQAQALGALTRTESRDGDAVGDHTQTHPLLSRLSPAAQQTEILSAAGHIRDAGAGQPLIFRPPYGAFDAATLDIARRAGMLMVLWTVDTKDFSQPGVARIVYTALSGARPGAIVLMHDGGGQRSQTVAALPRIIEGLKRRGFHPVTVPRLVADDPPLRGQPPPHSLAGLG